MVNKTHCVLFYQVRCICLIQDGDIASVNPLPEILGQMKGVFAIGGADGSLMLIDLCRDFIIRGNRIYLFNKYVRFKK